MNMRAGDIDLTVCCVCCGKRLPTLNGELQAWRSPDGQFFCDEFCADDYDEARFRKRSSASALPMQDVGGWPRPVGLTVGRRPDRRLGRASVPAMSDRLKMLADSAKRGRPVGGSFRC